MFNNTVFDDFDNEDISIKDFLLTKGKWVLGLLVGLSLVCLFLAYELYFSEGVIAEGSEDTLTLTSAEGETDVEVSGDSILLVEISGAVEHPGVYEFEPGARVVDVVKASGGVVGDASARWVSQNLSLASVVKDTQKIYIPFEWDFAHKTETTLLVEVQNILKNNQTPLVNSTSTQRDSSGATGASAEKAEDTTDSNEDEEDLTKINANKASQTELESLSGIGKAYSERIIHNRPYEDLADLQEKTRIPGSTLEKISEEITF